MKAKKEILGLRIINVQIGREIGTIKDIVLDSVRGSIAYFILDEPSDYFGARLISHQSALGLGNFALTVTGENVIQDVAHCPQAVELLRGDVQVVGSQVLTDKGGLVGTVSEIFFDENTGSIVQCRIQSDRGRVVDVAGQDVVTYGKLFTIITDDCILKPVEEGLSMERVQPQLTAELAGRPIIDEPAALKFQRKDPYGAALGYGGRFGKESALKASFGGPDEDPNDGNPNTEILPEGKGPFDHDERNTEPGDGYRRDDYQRSEYRRNDVRLNEDGRTAARGSDHELMLPDTGPPPVSDAQGHQKVSLAELVYPEGFNSFDRRQMQFLLGKKLTHRVKLDSGDVMEEGEFITAEMLSRVQTRGTLMELTAHVKK